MYTFFIPLIVRYIFPTRLTSQKLNYVFENVALQATQIKSKPK